MKKDVTTKYLTLFLIIDVVMVGVLLCFFSQKEWWNNWMITAPNVYMLMGAIYCQMMKKNLDKQVSRQSWLYLYKGIKMGITIVMLLLYISFVKQGSEAFVLITSVAYLLGLIVETYSFVDYLKHQQQ